MAKLTQEVLRIGVCDDEEDAIETISEAIRNAKLGLNVEIYTFTNGSDLVEFMDNSPFLHYIFLDIIMEGMSGIDAAKRILEKRPETQVIFVSNSNEYVEESDKLGAFNYFLKGDNVNMIPRDLSSVVDEFIRSAMFIRAKSRELGIVDVLISEILYVEIFDRILYIRTKNVKEECVTDLDTIIRLGNYYDFGEARLHTVVNFEHVVEINRTCAILSNGEVVWIAKRKHKAFKEKYQRYLELRKLDFNYQKNNKIGRYRTVEVVRTIK